MCVRSRTPDRNDTRPDPRAYLPDDRARYERPSAGSVDASRGIICLSPAHTSAISFRIPRSFVRRTVHYRYGVIGNPYIERQLRRDSTDRITPQGGVTRSSRKRSFLFYLFSFLFYFFSFLIFFFFYLLSFRKRVLFATINRV